MHDVATPASAISCDQVKKGQNVTLSLNSGTGTGPLPELRYDDGKYECRDAPGHQWKLMSSSESEQHHPSCSTDSHRKRKVFLEIAFGRSAPRDDWTNSYKCLEQQTDRKIHPLKERGAD